MFEKGEYTASSYLGQGTDRQTKYGANAVNSGMLRARERVWRSLRTPQQSLWVGGLGGFLHMVAVTISCGMPLLLGRLVGLAVAKVRGTSLAFRALSSM